MTFLSQTETSGISNKPMKLFPHFSTGNYPYVVARVKAKRASLLSHDTYAKLLMMDATEIIRFLGETQYKKEITELGLKYKGFELIEIALNKNMSDVFHQILEFCEGDLATMLAAYLQREDIWNIMSIIRGKFYHASVEEIMKSIRPAGKYPEHYWRELTNKSKNIEEVISNLNKTEYYPILHPLTEGPVNDLSTYEDKMIQEYYASLLSSIQSSSEANQLFKQYLKKEIDLTNIKTLLMTKYENVEPDKILQLLIKGGNISEKELKKLVFAQNFPQLLDALKTYPLFRKMGMDIETIEKTGTLNDVIRGSERNHLAEATRFSYIHPLSILPVLDYILRKRVEVENLRILVKGKEKGLDGQTIKSLLVIEP